MTLLYLEQDCKQEIQWFKVNLNLASFDLRDQNSRRTRGRRWESTLVGHMSPISKFSSTFDSNSSIRVYLESAKNTITKGAGSIRWKFTPTYRLTHSWSVPPAALMMSCACLWTMYPVGRPSIDMITSPRCNSPSVGLPTNTYNEDNLNIPRKRSIHCKLCSIRGLSTNMCFNKNVLSPNLSKSSG